MRIAIYAYSDKNCGMGHLYRTMALSRAAERLGHRAAVIGNIMTKERVCIQARKNSADDFLHVMHRIKPDWIIIDLQRTKTPEYALATAAMIKAKILVINGVGRYGDWAGDLNIVQGILPESQETPSNVFSGPKYVILRDSLFKTRRIPENDRWFVFGGAGDRMNLLQWFSNHMPDDPAMLVTSAYSNGYPEETDNHRLYMPRDESIFRLMSRADKACVATGMIIWELIALGIPVYAFSYTIGHLAFAKEMENADLIRACNETGPCNPDMLKLEPIIPPKELRPHKNVASKIIKMMEKF